MSCLSSTVMMGLLVGAPWGLTSPLTRTRSSGKLCDRVARARGLVPGHRVILKALPSSLLSLSKDVVPRTGQAAARMVSL